MVFQIYFPLLTLLFFTLNVTALPDEQNPADLLSIPSSHFALIRVTEPSRIV